MSTTGPPPHLILLDLIPQTLLREEYRSLSSSLCSFLYSPATLSLLRPNILLSNLLSNTLSLCSSLNVSRQVSHPYKRTGKIIVLYIIIFNFSIANWKTKDSAQMRASNTLHQSALNFLLNRILIL